MSKRKPVLSTRKARESKRKPNVYDINHIISCVNYNTGKRKAVMSLRKARVGSVNYRNSVRKVRRNKSKASSGDL